MAEYISKTCSFLVARDGKTFLRVGRFNGREITITNEIQVAQAQNWRGWSWDGKTASYTAVKEIKVQNKLQDITTLYIRSFDGYNFSNPIKEIKLGKRSDNWRGWCWDGKNTASYIAEMNGPINLYVRTFNGSSFGEYKTIKLSSIDNITGWNWDGKTAGFIQGFGTGNARLIMNRFDGIKFGNEERVINIDGNIFEWSWGL